MKKLFKKAKLFFYSFLFRKMFLSRVLKINIITVELLNHTGLIKSMSGTIGAVCGSHLTGAGIPITIGTPLGLHIGNFVGNIIDNELKEINNKVKLIDRSNDNYLENQKLESLLTIKLSNCIDDILDEFLLAYNFLTDDDKRLEDESLLNKFNWIMTNMEKKKFSNLFLSELLSDEKIRKILLEMIKTDLTK